MRPYTYLVTDTIFNALIVHHLVLVIIFNGVLIKVQSLST